MPSAPPPASREGRRAVVGRLLGSAAAGDAVVRLLRRSLVVLGESGDARPGAGGAREWLKIGFGTRKKLGGEKGVGEKLIL